MVEINGTTIKLTKGNTLLIQIEMEDSEGNAYIPAEGDEIRFAMKQKYSDEETLIYKEIPTESLILKLDPEDTKSLKAPASYVYDIQLTTAAGIVDTFIAKAKLTLTEEVE